MKIRVEWDTDGLTLEECGLSEIVEIEGSYDVDEEEISDLLSDIYGFCVISWCNYNGRYEVYDWNDEVIDGAEELIDANDIFQDWDAKFIFDTLENEIVQTAMFEPDED